MPGVVGVYTAADLGLAPLTIFAALNPATLRPQLAVDRVRSVGEAVAVVVAESKVAAVDAAQFVEVDYDPLPVFVDPLASIEPSAPLHFEEIGTMPNPRATSTPALNTDVTLPA